MWIFSTKGFLSCVEDYEDPDVIIVRARNKDHLRHHFEESRILSTPDADYGFRVRASRDEFVDLVRALAEAVDYPNYKYEASKFLGRKFVSRLHSIWQQMYAYQSLNED